MRRRSHLQQILSSVPAMIELLETRRVPSEVTVVSSHSPFDASNLAQSFTVQVENSSNENRITPVVQIDPSGNVIVNQATYAEDFSLFGVFAQNGVGYIPGNEFQFNIASTAYNFFAVVPLANLGTWFWI